ncbi:hypothetical protein [Singulisphaera sp. PoT]|uniref:hypothetical protein n=1 Tax=Singulisphaera sp. PoT TaxID=3411797 RepID=UPI003BF4850E
MKNAKADVLTACPGAEARRGVDPAGGAIRWTIHRSSGDATPLGSGATEGEAWSDALRRIVEESAMRR